jgi:hypothetical protein
MSIYAKFDTGEESQVASNSGWGDFCRWVEADGTAVNLLTLNGLVATGCCEPAEEIATELRLLVTHHAPANKDVLDVAQTLLSFLVSGKGDEVVLITNGMEVE